MGMGLRLSSSESESGTACGRLERAHVSRSRSRAALHRVLTAHHGTERTTEVVLERRVGDDVVQRRNARAFVSRRPECARAFATYRLTSTWHVSPLAAPEAWKARGAPDTRNAANLRLTARTTATRLTALDRTSATATLDERAAGARENDSASEERVVHGSRWEPTQAVCSAALCLSNAFQLESQLDPSRRTSARSRSGRGVEVRSVARVDCARRVWWALDARSVSRHRRLRKRSHVGNRRRRQRG